MRGLVRSRGLGDVYKRQTFDIPLGRGEFAQQIGGYGQVVAPGQFQDLTDAVYYTHLTLPTIYPV